MKKIDWQLLFSIILLILVIIVFMLIGYLVISKVKTATEDKTLIEAVGSGVKKFEDEFNKGYKSDTLIIDGTD